MHSKRIKVSGINTLSPLLEKLLLDGSAVKLTVTGNSMYPLFRSGVDEVVLRRKEKFSKYDILFYKRTNGKYVLHRIVKIKNDTLFLAGDFETVVEFPVYREQGLAVVDGFYRDGKFFSTDNWLYKLYSFVWVLLLPYRFSMIKMLKKTRLLLKGKGK